MRHVQHLNLARNSASKPRRIHQRSPSPMPLHWLLKVDAVFQVIILQAHHPWDPLPTKLRTTHQPLSMSPINNTRKGQKLHQLHSRRTCLLRYWKGLAWIPRPPRHSKPVEYPLYLLTITPSFTSCSRLQAQHRPFRPQSHLCAIV